MDLSPFGTTPATRHDGWRPELKVRFLDRLSTDGTVRGACALVGMSREAAYRLRRRDPLFARGWAAALGLARENGADVLTSCAIDGVEEEVWYRGELVGTRRRLDARLLLAHLARLDRLVEETPAGPDADRFDELLALMAGESAPGEFVAPRDPMPFCREMAADVAADIANDEHLYAEYEAEEKEARGELTPAETASREAERRIWEAEVACREDVARARTIALAQWDNWFRRACARVDEALAGSASNADGSPRTVSTVSTSGAEGGAPSNSS